MDTKTLKKYYTQKLVLLGLLPGPFPLFSGSLLLAAAANRLAVTAWFGPDPAAMPAAAGRDGDRGRDPLIPRHPLVERGVGRPYAVKPGPRACPYRSATSER